MEKHDKKCVEKLSSELDVVRHVRASIHNPPEYICQDIIWSNEMVVYSSAWGEKHPSSDQQITLP